MESRVAGAHARILRAVGRGAFAALHSSHSGCGRSRAVSEHLCPARRGRGRAHGEPAFRRRFDRRARSSRGNPGLRDAACRRRHLSAHPHAQSGVARDACGAGDGWRGDVRSRRARPCGRGKGGCDWHHRGTRAGGCRTRVRHRAPVCRRHAALHLAGIPVSRGRRARHQLPSARVDVADAGVRVCRARESIGGLRARRAVTLSVFQLRRCHVRDSRDSSPGECPSGNGP